MPLLPHAVDYADDETSWVSAQNKFIELPLSPRASALPEHNPSTGATPPA